MLRYVDGCDHYGTADINSKWTNSSGATVSSGTGRFGGSSLRVGDVASGSFVQKTLDAQATWIVGCGIQLPGFPSAAAPIIRLLDQGSQQVELRVNPDGTLSVTRNGTSVSGGTSTVALRAGTYHFVELKVTISDAISASTCKVRINGVDAITVATGQDLKNTANATANSVTFHGAVSATQLDDFYVCDGTGSANLDFLGDCRVITVLPNAAGDKSEMTLTGTGLTQHYQAVNDNPPDGDTTYVSSSTLNQIDLFHFADVSIAGTVRGVQISLLARKDDAGTRTMASVVKSAGTEYVGSSFSLGTGYQYFSDVRETDPATGAAWTVGNFNSAQAGVKLVS